MATLAPPAGTIRPPGRVGLGTKIAYGFGSIAYGIKDNGFQTLLMLYYNQVVGVPAHLVGLAMMTALVLDAFIDPVIGQLSDQTRSRFGKRHPWMYFAALPVGLLYLLLWFPPLGSTMATVLYLVAVSIAIRTVISCYEVPSAALAPELTRDYHERTSVLGYRYLFGWAGGIAMVVLTFGYFLAPTAEYPVGQLNPDGYKKYAFVAAAVMIGAILISALGTHRRAADLARHSPPAERKSLKGNFRAIMAAFRHRSFLILTLAGVFAYTNQGLNAALATYINTYVWAFPAGIIGVLTVATLVGVVLAFLLANFLSRRMGKREAAILSISIYLVVAILPLTLRYFDRFLPNGDPLLLPVLMALVVIGTTFGVANAILGASMMSDVVEEAEENSGERQEGVFFAGSFFMQKCVSGFGLFLSGAILSAVAFPTGAMPGKVPQTVLDDLILTYVVIKVILGAATIAVLARYPITRDQHEQRIARLAQTASHSAPLPGSEPELR